MMKTGKNNRFLASILAASMILTMSPFAFAADETEQKEMTTQEQVQSAAQNETNANPAVSQMDSQSSEDTNSEAPKTEGQSPKDTNSEGGQPSKDVNPAGKDTTAGGSTSTSETPTEPETPAEPEASKNAAKIGEKEYPTVAAAMADAQPGDTIELLKDITESVEVRVTKNFEGELTIDLNKYSIDGDSHQCIWRTYRTNCWPQKLIVKNGTLKNAGSGSALWWKGDLKVVNCRFENNQAAQYSLAVAIQRLQIPLLKKNSPEMLLEQQFS